MSDDRPPGVGWLHYRLVVAVGSAVAAGVTMLVVPLVIGVVGRGAEPMALYALVFSKWGVATLIAFAILGFIIGDERMANLLAVIWGTHPVWSRVNSWLEENELAKAALLFALLAFLAGFIWYSFR